MRSREEQKEYSNHVADGTAGLIVQTMAKGLSFYLAFMVWDYFVSPDNYPTMWAIRIGVVSLCAFLLAIRHHHFIQRNRRFFYMFCIALVMNSVAILWSIKSKDALPGDVSLVALTLIFAMAALRLDLIDALRMGAIYLTSFVILLSYRGAPADVWRTYFTGLGIAYGMGAVCASVATSYFYSAFLVDKRLRFETERADNLLTKTFPLEIANQLKAKPDHKPVRIDDATVLFCDIVNFTEISASMPPETLVSSLNQIFSAFDRLTYQHGCEKIKTIGDAYMVAAGVPTPCADHAERVVKLALAIQMEAKAHSMNGMPLQVRVGINSGPLVAGVIGEIRFAYDIWGDTVNTASRIESLCKPGKILMTETTKSHLGHEYRLQKISNVMVKGKGQMDVWELSDAVQINAVSSEKKSA